MPIPRELELQDNKIKTEGIAKTRDLTAVLTRQVEVSRKFLEGGT